MNAITSTDTYQPTALLTPTAAPEARQFSGAIHERGFWTDDNEDGHHYDTRLSKELGAYFRNRTVIDMGCGKGDYVRHLRRLGITCDGCDGNPITKKFDDTLHIIDLSEPFKLKMAYDWVLCLEVGEHIPKDYEQVLFDNICAHAAHGVVLSWAVPGQLGRGHVNERSNEYVKIAMDNQNFWYDHEWSVAFRGVARLPWFKNTLMVFKRSKSI